MLILIEGCDCSGKSELTERLRVALNRRFRTPDSSLTLHHKGPPTQHPLREYAEPLLDYHVGREQYVVCDRWHVGETVYPAVLGRETQLDAAVNTWLELFLLSRGALLVHVRQTPEYLTRCGEHRGDDAAVLERIPSTAAAFERAVSSTLLPTISLDDGPVGDDDVANIVEQAALLEARAWPTALRSTTTYVGAPRPSLLLVGDRRGVVGEPTDYGDWPAFAPFPATSGHWLLRALTDRPPTVRADGHALATLGIANANDVDDVARIWRNADEPPVVALGSYAAAKLRRLRVPHRFVRHPQWWRRFRHHDGEAFVADVFQREVSVGA